MIAPIKKGNQSLNYLVFFMEWFCDHSIPRTQAFRLTVCRHETRSHSLRPSLRIKLRRTGSSLKTSNSRA